MMKLILYIFKSLCYNSIKINESLLFFEKETFQVYFTKENYFMKASKPTMKDVSREAGVALGTVSRVFNGQSVGEEYRIKVEEAAQRLGYQVNSYARGLKTNKTNIIAVILPSTDHPYFASLAQQLSVALTRRNYRMMLFLSDSHHEREDECIRLVRQNKVDGIIGLTYSMVQLGEDIPFISIDRYFHSNVPCVASDNYGGGRLAAEKLAACGCKKLLFLRTGSSVPGEADKRGDGFVTACTLMQMPYDTFRMNECKDMDLFREFFLKHMTEGKLEYDGIFCSTDLLAAQIRSLLEDMGIRVPQDVQIIGFDGIRRFDTGGYYCTTIVQPVDKIAESCVDMLLREDRSNVPSLVCLPVTCAFGGTTKE